MPRPLSVVMVMVDNSDCEGGEGVDDDAGRVGNDKKSGDGERDKQNGSRNGEWG